MAKLIEVSGSLTITPDVGTGSDRRQLSLGPGGSCGGQQYYEESVCNAPTISTSGNLGDNFEDLSAADALSEIHLLYIKSNANIVLRLYALPATLQAVAGAFPTGFVGAEVSTITIDGTAVAVTFDAADQTAAQCAARINAAAALAGFSSSVATVVNGQLLITGAQTAVGSGGIGQITADAGAPSVTLGLAPATAPTSVDAQGQDVGLYGLFLAEFPRTGSNILTKVQVSGQASLDIVAAGRA